MRASLFLPAILPWLWLSPALAEAPPHHAADVQTLIAALQSDPPSPLKVRARAATLLGLTDSSDALEPLVSGLAADSDPSVRAACAAALGSLGRVQGVAPLVRALADPEPLVVSEARRSLLMLCRPESATYAVAAAAAAPAAARLVLTEMATCLDAHAGTLWVELLADGDPRVRAKAEAAFGKLSRATRIQQLLSGLDHASYRVRGRWASGRAAERHGPSVSRLAGLAADALEAQEVRASAWAALVVLVDGAPVEREATRARDASLAPTERARALIIRAATEKAASFDACAAALASPEEALRVAGAIALAQLGDARALPYLEDARTKEHSGIALRLMTHAIRVLQARRP